MKLGDQCTFCKLTCTEEHLIPEWGYPANDDGLCCVDPCLGKLPGVENACCGHGGHGYISYETGVVIRYKRLYVDKAPEPLCPPWLTPPHGSWTPEKEGQL